MRISKYATVMFALVLTACSGAGNSGGSSDSSAAAQKAINQVNMTQIKSSVSNAKTALTNAQAAVAVIFNSDGSFNWSILWNGVNFSNLDSTTQTCLAAAFPNQDVITMLISSPQDIANALACILNDVVTVAGIATGDMNTALTLLNSALAQAGTGSAEATEIQALITDIQSLQVSYKTLLTSLASQIGLANAFLSTLPSLASGVCPIPGLSFVCGFAVTEYIQPIEQEIMHFQDQLESL